MEKPAKRYRCEDRADALRDEKGWRITWTDTGEGVGEGVRDGHGRVGKLVDAVNQ